MSPRLIKKNQRLPIIRRPGRKTIHGLWPVGVAKMVSIPIRIESHTYRNKPIARKKGVTKNVISSSSSTRWVFALVRRDGPTNFIVLERSATSYSEKDPGKRVLDILAREIGLPKAPNKITRILPKELGQL